MGIQERRRLQGQVPPSCEMLLRAEGVKDRGMTVCCGHRRGSREGSSLWTQLLGRWTV